LKAAYEPYWSKSVILKFWNMHLERWASPVLVGFYEEGIDQDIIDRLVDILADLQIGTVAKVPEGIRIEPIQMKSSTGAQLYEKAVEKRDRMICRAMLVPDLLGMGEATKGGSYALGKKQHDLFFTMLTFLGCEIEELIMEQLTKQLIDMNFGKVERYPRFQFEPFEEHSSEQVAKMNVSKAQVLQILANAGFIDPLDENVQKAAMDYINILPGAGKGSMMAAEALDFKQPLKFTSPDGREAFELEIEENIARFQLLQDALEVA
jgi:phage gp29-like protein